MRPDMAVQDGGGATNRMMYYTPAGSDTYFTNYHQGRSIHSGPPPPPHHTGVLPGVVTGANVITQGGGGGVGGGGGGPAQAPTPPGASPHDMAKQGGGPPTQPTHVGAHSQMPGASTFSMNYTISNSQRHSGPQTQYFRTPNQQRMATNPRSQVMNSNGMPTIGFPQITSFPMPQVHFMQPQWVSHRQAPGYPFSASAQTQMMFQSVYPYVSNQSQSHYMMGPLRPPAAGASTGGGGHGGTPPQQQPIQQQSPVPLQQQTVMGAGGSPAGGISLGGGGGPSGHAVGVYQPVPLSTMVNMGGNVGQPTVQNKSKPRLHAVPILDPVTGKNVVNEMLKSEENSGATSDSPARTEKEEKIAEFSSKIGKAAASSSETDVSPPQPQPSETSGEGTMPQISGAMNGPSENLYSIPSENVGLSQLGMNVSSEPWKQTSEKERDPTVEPSICDTVNQKTVDYVAAAKLETVMEEPESSPVVQTLALNQFEGQQTPVVSARGGGVRVPSPVAANVVPIVKQQQPAPIVSPLPVNQPVEAMPPPSMSAKPHPQAQAAKEVTREFPAKNQVAASKPLQTSTHKPTHAVTAAGEGNDPMVTRKVMPTSREGSSERKKITEVVPKEDEEKKEEKTVEPVIPTPVEEPLPQRQPPQANGDESIDGKPVQRCKTKKVHKNRELNRKGAEKEGTDMDAFSDAQQLQKQEAAAVLTSVNSAASAPVSQRIDTPMQSTTAMDEKVVNETIKARTLTPPPANQLPPAPKTSALPPSVTSKGATVANNENVPVQLNSNTSNKVESHPPKNPSSKSGNEKNLDNKLSTMEMPPIVPEQNFVGNSKRDDVEKEVSVEKIPEDGLKEVAKTDQINENCVESIKVEKDMSTAEKNDKEEEEIVAARNNENKLSSLPANEKEEEEISSNKKEQDAEMDSVPDAPAVIENVTSETLISKLIAKNNYKDDQWSPINPQGKKKYDREFLLGLQNDPQSVKKPENLPDMDIVVKDNANRAPSRQVDLKNIAQLSRNSQDFAPCFVKSLTSRPMAPKRGSQQGKPKGGSKIVYVTIPSNSDVKLHEAENAWKPRNKQPGKDGRAEQKEAEELYASMRGILNKLTPQNFEKLVQQVLRLPIDTMEKLVGVIDLVFDKAVDEPNFSVAYAELCNYLNNADIAKKVKKGDDSSNENFRKILLKRCQKEFEKDKAADYGLHEREKEIEKEPNEEKRKEMRLQLEEDERRIRRQSVGVMRFIGELYKLGMINQFIMVTCIKTLLQAGDEDSLECLCKLLTTVGKYLEESLEKKISSGAPNTPNINLYFTKMKNIVSERKTSSRVRFMLQDVIDLRNSKWVPRRNEANPKKIDEINLDAERESMEQSQLTANYSQMSRGSGGLSRRDEKSKGDEWNTVPSKNRVFNVDPHKLKVTDTENVQLGSRSQHSVWCKGATGGSSGMGSEKKQSNFYSMLSEDSGSREGSNRRMPMRHKDSSQTYTKSSSTSAVGISPAEERERALNALRDNARGPQTSMESPRLRGVPPSKTSSRDSSVSEERSLANSKAQKAPAYIMSKEDLDKLCKMTLDDYTSTNNAKETYEYMKVELPPANYVDFIQFSVEKVLESNATVRQSVGHLLAYLISHQLFNKQLFAKGLNKVLVCAEELILDVPKFWDYIADILGVMLEEEAVPLSILPYFTTELPENLQGPLVVAVLNFIHKSKGPAWVNEKWAESGLRWNDLIPAKNVEKLVKDNGLEYILDGSGHSQSKSGSITMDHVKEKIVFLLKSSRSADAVFEWIAANVHDKITEPSFIRALTTAVIESAMENQFKSPVVDVAHKILQRYLNSIEKHELQCLYAIQVLVHKLEHPKGLILKIFEFLHNHDLISAESFIAWQRSSDEPDGKAVLLKSLTQFFTYLTEIEDESAEEA